MREERNRRWPRNLVRAVAGVALSAVAAAAAAQGPAPLDPDPVPGGGAGEGPALGAALALDAGCQRAWVGAPRWALGAARAGLVFEFESEPGGWRLTHARRDPDAHENDQLGWSLARQGPWLLAGAPLASALMPAAGKVCAWRLDAPIDEQPQRLVSPAGQPGDGFGMALQPDASGVWIAAPFGRSPGGAWQAGRIEHHVPGPGGGSWQVDQVQEAPLPWPYVRFGSAMAPGPMGILASAPYEPDGGGVYHFGPQLERVPNPTGDGSAEFGLSLAASGPWVAVGAPGAAGDRGAVALYAASAMGAGPVIVLWGGGEPGRFGSALAWSGASLLVGAPGAAGGAGRVSVYSAQPSGWTLQQSWSNPGSFGLGAALAGGPDCGPSGGSGPGGQAGALVGAPARAASSSPFFGGPHEAGPAGRPRAWWMPLAQR